MTKPNGGIKWINRLLCTLLTVCVTAPVVCAQHQPDPTEKSLIEQLTRDLPNSSLLKSELEAGLRGDGVRKPWMDFMQRQGVKRAWVVLNVLSNRDRNDFTLNRITYYSGYKGGASQISDPGLLDSIEKSGLPNVLTEAAIDRARSDPWEKKGYLRVPVDLLEDQWLPPVNYDEVQKHLRVLEGQLSPDSDLRHELASGYSGDGDDYVWTAHMRDEGIKRAEVVIQIHFYENGKPKEMHIQRVRYFTSYDTDASEIIDSNTLNKIDQAGLPQELQRTSLNMAQAGSWIDVPNPRPNPFVGETQITFYDDLWLPFLNHPLYSTSLSGQ